jgi:hypothetical protein
LRSNFESFLMRSSMGLKTPRCVCSRPPAPSDVVAYHDPSGGVPAAAITFSLVVTSGSPSKRLTVMFVWGVKVFFATWAYHWLCPVWAATPDRVRMSIVTGARLAVFDSSPPPLPPGATPHAASRPPLADTPATTPAVPAPRSHRRVVPRGAGVTQPTRTLVPPTGISLDLRCVVSHGLALGPT